VLLALVSPGLIAAEPKTPAGMEQFWDMVAHGDTDLAQKQLLLMRDDTVDDMLTKELLTAYLYHRVGDQVTMHMCLEAVDSLLYAAYISKTITLPDIHLEDP
jgi:hypothetical protein